MRRCLIAGLLLLIAATAGAQTPADAADAYFREGNSLYKEQRWAEARSAYESAWRLKKAHDVAANLAYAEMKLGRWRDAAEHLSFAVKNWPPTGKADKRDYAVERFQIAKQEVGTLAIQVEPPRAEVLVDGVVVGQSPLGDEVFVEPGSHTVEAKRAGYQDAKQLVQAAKGSAQTVTLALAAAPPPPPPSTGTVPVPRPPPWRPGPALIIPAGALAAGGIAIGAGLTVAANGKASDVRAMQGNLKQGGNAYPCAGASGTTATTCSKLRDTATAQQTLSDGAFASFVTGGAFALVAAGLGIWTTVTPRDAGPKSALSVAPVVGAGAGGVVVVGQW
jgi:hypothetical protein